jgi:hypothetical protein
VRVACSASGLPAADQARSRLTETPRRRRVPAARPASAKRMGGARTRVRARPLPTNPERAKPKGASGGRRTNPASAARDSRKGQSPEAAARWAGPALQRRENRREKRHVGSPARKRGGYLPRGESSEGRIPRAPPARKKAGTGSEGVSRREGNQTLRAERSGCPARPAKSGPPIPRVL